MPWGSIARFAVCVVVWQLIFRVDDKHMAPILGAAFVLILLVDQPHVDLWFTMFCASGVLLVALNLLGTMRARRKSIRRMAAARPPGLPMSFGYKTMWVAIRCDSAQKVLDALQLASASPADFGVGLERAYEDGLGGVFGGSVFVTPPLKGWVLVVGGGLPSCRTRAR
jgi:hypothetical protein